MLKGTKNSKQGWSLQKNLQATLKLGEVTNLPEKYTELIRDKTMEDQQTKVTNEWWKNNRVQLAAESQEGKNLHNVQGRDKRREKRETNCGQVETKKFWSSKIFLNLKGNCRRGSLWTKRSDPCANCVFMRTFWFWYETISSARPLFLPSFRVELRTPVVLFPTTRCFLWSSFSRTCHGVFLSGKTKWRRLRQLDPSRFPLKQVLSWSSSFFGFVHQSAHFRQNWANQKQDLPVVTHEEQNFVASKNPRMKILCFSHLLATRQRFRVHI